MSIMGTGAAAAVAQTGLNAQQQARRADKTSTERRQAAADAAAAFVERLNGPADADDPTEDLPDRGALGYENLYGPDGQLHGPGFDAAAGHAGGHDPGAVPHQGIDVTG